MRTASLRICPGPLLLVAATFGMQIPQPANERAMAVIIGQITAGESTASGVMMRIQVQRVFYGEVSPGAILDVDWGGKLQGSGSAAGITGLWKLEGKANGRWAVIPVLGGGPFGDLFFPVASESTRNATFQAVPNLKKASDLIAAELASVVEEAPNRHAFRMAATGILTRNPHTEGTLALFTRLSRSPKPAVAAVGFVGLVIQGSPDNLDRIERHWPEIDKAGFLRWQLKGGIAMRVEGSPENVAAFARIVSSATLPGDIRTAAAEALRNIHSRDTVPLFITMLDSPVPEIRQHAFAGLSFFVENLGMATRESTISMSWRRPQGPTPYRTPETDKFNGYWRTVPVAEHPQYVAFWKSWWTQFGAEIMKK